LKFDTRNPAALGMFAVGILLMAATLVYSLIVKAPDPKAAVAKLSGDIVQYKKDTKKSDQDAATKLASTQMRLWTDSDDVIAPKTLKILTDLAEKHGLKVSSFRPQKEMAAGALTILPFFVSVDGPFPGVGDYLRDFEENQQTLIVTNVQIASSDQNTHAVTGSIEVCAYIDPNRDAGKAAVVSTGTSDKTKPAPNSGSGGKGSAGAPAEASKSHTTPSIKSEAAHSVRELPSTPSKA
jgi:hypothetical protein